MRYIITILAIALSLMASEPKKYTAEIVPKKMSVQEKKARFYALINPAVQKVHSDLMRQYEKIKEDMKTGKNKKEIERLKESYNATTNQELLLALKPHPQSIALAQAAMESAWATSRFFVKAKNIFGMWSVNPNEPRIAAGEKRGGTRTIWLRKFETIEDSVKAYYKLMGRAKTYKAFREVRYVTNDPFKIILKLDKYSEIGKEYPKELGSMIRYNKLTKYDK
jgi:Bax protein